jgi:hypothetical protein
LPDMKVVEGARVEILASPKKVSDGHAWLQVG